MVTSRQRKARARKASSRAKADTPRVVEDGRLALLLRALKGDAHLATVVQDFEERANNTASGRKFGSNGLKVNGKLFALFTQGTLVVKLPTDRVAALIASDVGKAFDPGHGRLMKEWLTVTNPRASWTELVKEAYEFVSADR